MTTNAADQFLMGGGVGSASFTAIGDSVTGRITEPPEVRQQTDLDGKPKVWDDGQPQNQLVVTLQTDERDATDPDDDGRRRVYVKGSKKSGSKSMHDAVVSAVRAAGAKGLQVGGTLTVRFTGERAAATRGYNPAKEYEATYAAPSGAEFLGTDTPAPAAAPQAPAAPAAPAAAPATQQQQAPNPVAIAQNLIAAGVEDAAIVGATGLDMAVIASLRANAAA